MGEPRLSTLWSGKINLCDSEADIIKRSDRNSNIDPYPHPSDWTEQFQIENKNCDLGGKQRWPSQDDTEKGDSLSTIK